MSACIVGALVGNGFGLIAGVSLPAEAAEPVVWSSAVAVDTTLQPEIQAHGIVLVAADVFGLPRQSRASVELNTDTLRLTWEDVQIGPRWLRFGARATGQALFAGVLVDYWQDGRNDLSRGIFASYAMVEAWAKAELPGRQYVDLALGGRWWFFRPTERTDPTLRLPADTPVMEPRLRYTLWRLQDDPSLRERHRLHPRVAGVAVGVQLGLDLRQDARPWGLAPDPLDAATEITDPRNEPERMIVHVRQWARAGAWVGRRARVQGLQAAAWGHGEDDLTRDRLGGLTPYVIPIAGTGWPAWLSERHVSGELSLHVRVFDDTEMGVLGHVAYIDDAGRTGRSAAAAISGIGGFADVRHGPWQAHVRGGWSPTLHEPGAPATSLFVSIGYGGR